MNMNLIIHELIGQVETNCSDIPVKQIILAPVFSDFVLWKKEKSEFYELGLYLFSVENGKIDSKFDHLRHRQQRQSHSVSRGGNIPHYADLHFSR